MSQNWTCDNSAGHKKSMSSFIFHLSPLKSWHKALANMCKGNGNSDPLSVPVSAAKEKGFDLI